MVLKKKKEININSGIDKNIETYYNDESLMLRENLADIPNIINSDRAVGGREAITKHNVDCLILDDGFQHLRLNRSLNIVVINALNPFGRENVIPRGFLREPLWNLQRADLFIITHTNLCSRKELEKIHDRLYLIKNNIPVVESIHSHSHIENLAHSSVLPVEWLKGKKVYAFCALGSPESFFQSLLYHGAGIIKSKIFTDHHFYSDKELKDIILDAKQLGSDAIITTHKDKVKVCDALTENDLQTCGIAFNVLKINIKITKNKDCFEKLIDNVL